MGFRDKLKEHREDLQEQDSKLRDESVWGSYFLRDQLPKDMGFWNCGEGDHLIDVIPFYSGPNHPKGQNILVWNVVVYVHQGIGVTRDQYVCPAYMYKKPDPICEFITRERPPKEEWQKIKPKLRNAMLVWVHDSIEEENKGVQIWEIADFFFGAKIKEIAQMPRGGGVIQFAHPDHGKMIAFKRAGKGAENTEFLGHRFHDRTEQVPDHILDQSFSLDEAINWHPTYKEMYESFYGQEMDGDGPPPADTREQQPVRGLKRSGEQKTDSEDHSRPEDPPPEQPKQRLRPPEPGPKPGRETPKGGCPHGHEFGVDIEQKAECTGCSEWDNCSDEADRIEKAQRETRQTESGGRLRK